MKKKCFTLLELLAAILIGSLVMLMISGGLMNSINSWRKVQTHVSENYNRRSVLDMMRRQVSSLFYKREADQLAQTPRLNGATNTNRSDSDRRNLSNRGSDGRRLSVQEMRQRNNGNGDENDPNNSSPMAGGRNATPNQMLGGQANRFQLPPGAHFFRGNLQEINFISTVSFLTDFPGHVGVKYYVVQGTPGEDGDLADLESTRSSGMDAGGSFDPNQMVDPAEAMAALEDFEELEGNLWLYIEEKNLFLSTAVTDPDAALNENPLDQPPPSLFPDDQFMNRTSGQDGAGAQSDENLLPEGEAQPAVSMQLLGPLRKFNIRYRKPALRADASEADEEDDWAEIWDAELANQYPSAVEFILFYERPGETDHIPTEELPGVRMVLPIYDSQNLIRGNNSYGVIN
jgi:type II secretory pathway pseudopilin PulG